MAYTFSYDPYGNLTAEPDAAGAVTTYSLDLADRLTAFDPPTTDATTYGECGAASERAIDPLYLDRDLAGGGEPATGNTKLLRTDLECRQWYGLPCAAIETRSTSSGGVDNSDWLITQLTGQSPDSAAKTLMYLGLIENEDWSQFLLNAGMDAATLASVMTGPGGVRALGGAATRSGLLGERAMIDRILRDHTATASTQFKLTANQLRALDRGDESLRPLFNGERIDTLFKDLVRADTRINTRVTVTPRFQYGPDVYTPSGWWDVTTANSWWTHYKYFKTHGPGTSLFYGP